MQDASPRGRQVRLSVSGTGGNGTPECGGGLLHGGLRLLSRLAVDVDDPALACTVRLSVIARNGWLACESVTVTARPGAAPVTGGTMRTPRLGAYLAQLLAELKAAGGGLLVVRESARGPGWVSYDMAVGPDGWGALAPRRDAALTPAMAADCYRDVMASEDPELMRRATAAVAARLSASRGHISRLLTAARRQGLLGEATPGRAGETTAASAPVAR